MPAVTSILAGAAILGAGTSIYSAQQQKKASAKASDAAQRAEMEARRIAASGKPMEESATLDMNTGTADTTLGSLGLIVNPDLEKRKKAVAGLGTAPTGTGLGSAVTSSLGFGG